MTDHLPTASASRQPPLQPLLSKERSSQLARSQTSSPSTLLPHLRPRSPPRTPPRRRPVTTTSSLSPRFSHSSSSLSLHPPTRPTAPPSQTLTRPCTRSTSVRSRPARPTPSRSCRSARRAAARVSPRRRRTCLMRSAGRCLRGGMELASLSRMRSSSPSRTALRTAGHWWQVIRLR